jgi:hypothetical protein
MWSLPENRDSLNDNASRFSIALRLFDGDRSVEEGTDGFGVGA